MNKGVFVLHYVQKSSRRSVVNVSDKIKAIISMERSVYELFTGPGDLQYMPADLAKDPLPLHLSIYSSHLPLCLTHTLYTHTHTLPVYIYNITFIFLWSLYAFPIIFVRLHFSSSSLNQLFVLDPFLSFLIPSVTSLLSFPSSLPYHLSVIDWSRW